MSSKPSDRSPADTSDLLSDGGRARYFRYNVEQGGFAQLLYNLQGEHLQAFAEMLDRAGAVVAGRYFERALNTCLDDLPAYQAFLAGDYTSDNALKSSLQLLSVDYFKERISFDREGAAWLIGIGESRGLLIGIRAAHSGSATTYAYLGEVRAVWSVPTTDFLEHRFPAASSPRAPSGVLQATLHRQGRGAGLLGARFTPAPAATEIVVRVALGQWGEGYDMVGLSRSESEAVLAGIASQAAGAPFSELGPGRLDVLWAMSHPIDSSDAAFERLAISLVPLLALPVDAGEGDVTHAWRRQQDSVRIAETGGWLVPALAGRPDRGSCGAAASEAELASLEASLGVSLPEPLRWTLRQFNGLSFVDDRPTDENGVSQPTSTRCELLSTDQIQQEHVDLVAVNDAYTEVDGWEGRRPIRPRLRQPDGSLVPWPYLPVARTSEGRELLVLELSAARRVLDAFHGSGPPDWRPVYESFVDFLDAFVSKDGCVDAIGKSSAAKA